MTNDIRDTGRYRSLGMLALPAVGIGLLLFWHFGSVRDRGGLVDALLNAGHLPLFAAFTLIVLGLIRSGVPLAPAYAGPRPAGCRQYVLALLIMLLMAVGSELLQGMIPNRIASWHDVGTNLLGTVVGFALAVRIDPGAPAPLRRRGVRLALTVAAVGATLAVVLPLTPVLAAHAKRAWDYPVLVQFNSALDMRLVRAPNAVTERVALPRPWRRPEEDGRSLRLDLAAARYPGITIADPARDWRGHESLELDMTNPGDDALRLTLRINDAVHDGRFEDRFNGRITLAPESRQTITIPLEKIRRAPAGREMDLRRITTLILFASRADAERRFYLTRIALSPPPAR